MSELIIPAERIGGLEAYHASVIGNPGWGDVAKVFGTDLPKDLTERDQAIGWLSDAYWDSRNGAERQDASVNTYLEKLLAEQDKEGKEQAEGAKNGTLRFERGVQCIGLMGTRSLIEPVDSLFVPGALVDANMMRALHARNQGPSQKVYVGTERVLSDADKGRLQVYAPHAADARTEADSLRAILEVLHPERELVEGDERFEAYDTPDGRVYWGDAPKIEGVDRANTRDTYRFMWKMVGSDLGKTAAVATNDVYKFQDVDAQHILRGVAGMDRVDAATFTPQDGARLIEDAGYGEFPPKQRTPGTYAQELRSAHNSAKALKDTLERSRMA